MADQHPYRFTNLPSVPYSIMPELHLRMRRRQYLTTTTAITFIFAGCLQGGDTNGGIPDAASLLPQPEEYTIDEKIPQSAGIIGGDNGMQGVYTDGSGTEFAVEIIVFADEDAETAENNASSYTAGENWNLVVLYNNIIYAVSEISEKEAKDVLATSPQLDRSTIEANIVS